MDFFGTSHRINRSINVLMLAQSATTPEAIQAIKTLQGYGSLVIPKILDTCVKTRLSAPLLTLLATYVAPETLPLFRQGLCSPVPRVVATVVEVLTKSTDYDPHLLLDGFAEPGIAKSAVKQLLDAHKQSLNPAILLRVLETLSAEDRSLLSSLVLQTASATTVSALIAHLQSDEEDVRLLCTQTLMRFPIEAVRTAFYTLLTDPSSRLRLAALAGLGRLPFPPDFPVIFQRLADEDARVRAETKRFLSQCQVPQLLEELFNILEDAASPIRADAADLLGTVRDVRAMQATAAARPHATATCAALLRLLSAPNTQVRRMALVGLTSVKSTFDITSVSPFLWDADHQSRRLAVAILKDYKVPQTIEALKKAFRNETSVVRLDALAILDVIADTHIVREVLGSFREEEEAIAERAITLLGSRGATLVIQAALEFTADADAYLRRTVATLLTLTNDATVVPYLVDMLAKPEAWVRRCAAEVLGMLGSKGRDAVPALMAMALRDEAEGLIALDTLTNIGDARAIPVCLTHMQHGMSTLQEKALHALAVVTDGKNFDAVLYPLLALRDSVPQARKALFNQTAVTIVRRFPGRLTLDKVWPTIMTETQVIEVDIPENMGVVGPSLVVNVVPQEAVRALEESPAPPTDAPVPQLPAETPTAEVVDPTAGIPGTMLGGRYLVIQRIGEGGFGTVVLVKDTVVNEELILKFLHPRFATDQLMMQRFIHELLYARRITHEHVIRIHDFLQFGHTYAIAMEYFAGHNLANEIEEQRFLTDRQRGFHILVSICRGMQRAHQIGILHRDMKPTNILINDEGIVKIVDFGLAAVMTDDATQLTRVGEMLGTPLYMAPEQANNGKLDARTDIYSLGVIMYEMFTGQPPYGGDRALAILFQHVAGNLTPPRTVNPEIPPAVEAIIVKAMAVDPGQRFQRMEEFESRLLPLLS